MQGLTRARLPCAGAISTVFALPLHGCALRLHAYCFVCLACSSCVAAYIPACLLCHHALLALAFSLASRLAAKHWLDTSKAGWLACVACGSCWLVVASAAVRLPQPAGRCKVVPCLPCALFVARLRGGGLWLVPMHLSTVWRRALLGRAGQAALLLLLSVLHRCSCVF
jgi:hypothetical protein